MNDEKSGDFMRGVLAIMVTGRADSGAVDPEKTRSHAEFLLNNGLRDEKSAIVSTGSIGECAALSEEERIQVWEATLEGASGNVPVIAGINHTNTDQVVEMASKAAEVGAQGVMLMTPYYWAPSKRSVKDFFFGVLDQIDLPVLLYNNIPATQMDLPLELITDFAEHEIVGAIKECTPDFTKLERVFRAVGQDINVINGNGEFWEPYASVMGCHGLVSGLVNFAPEKTVEIRRYSKEGNYKKVHDIKKDLQPYFEFFFEVTNKYGMSVEPAILKNAASLVGSNVGPVKPPVTDLTSEEEEQLRHSLEESDLLE